MEEVEAEAEVEVPMFVAEEVVEVDFAVEVGVAMVVEPILATSR
jgi:hypothetical protein